MVETNTVWQTYTTDNKGRYILCRMKFVCVCVVIRPRHSDKTVNTRRYLSMHCELTKISMKVMWSLGLQFMNISINHILRKKQNGLNYNPIKSYLMMLNIISILTLLFINYIRSVAEETAGNIRSRAKHNVSWTM